MRITYSPEVDAMRITFRKTTITHTEELEDGVLADYDGEERIVGLEILDASEKIDHPEAMEYIVYTPDMVAAPGSAA